MIGLVFTEPVCLWSLPVVYDAWDGRAFAFFDMLVGKSNSITKVLLGHSRFLFVSFTFLSSHCSFLSIITGAVLAHLIS
jgi:hypothetical protein